MNVHLYRYFKFFKRSFTVEPRSSKNSKSLKFAVFVQTLIIILIGSTTLFSQNNSEIDSFIQLIPTKSDTAKVNLLSKISSAYLIENYTDSSLLYAQKTLDLSKQIDYTKGIAIAFFRLAQYYQNINEKETATNYYLDAISICESNKYEDIASQLYISFGYFAYIQTDYYTAIEYAQKAIDISKDTVPSLILANSYNNISAVYMDLNEYRKALIFSQKAYHYLPKQEQHNQGKYYIESNIFKNYLKLGIIDSAQLFLKKLDTTVIANGSLHSKTILYEMKGDYYTFLGEYNKANILYFNILQLMSNNNLSQGESQIYLLSVIKFHIGSNLFYMQQYDSSKIFLKAAYDGAEQYGGLSIMANSALLLGKLEKKKASYKTAIAYYETYKMLSDSLDQTNKIKQMAQLEMRRDFTKIIEQKEEQQAHKEAKLAAKIERQKWLSYTLVSLLFIALGFSLYIYINIRIHKKKNKLLSEQKKEIHHKNINLKDINTEVRTLLSEVKQKNLQLSTQTKRLNELDKIKSHFFANISHEFRTPLTLIMAKADKISNINKSLAIESKSMLKDILWNSKSLLKLVNQLLDLSKIEANAIKINAHSIDCINIVKRICFSWDSYINSKDLHLKYFQDTDIAYINIDIDKLETIINNLIFNAIKFTPQNGIIRIEQTIKDNNYFLTIADTGKGISTEQQKYIFQRFYQVEDINIKTHHGTGIGLSIVKEFVQLMNGKINFKSKLNQGSSFTISFPLVELAQNSVVSINFEPQKHEIHTQQFHIQDLKNTTTENKANKILLVEDNTEMRNFIYNELQNNYDVIVAKDGEEGVEKAFKTIPDLIISDVIMPRMDGYSLCKTIKNDVRTNHIPIILLTAKSLKNNIVEGFVSGTDDYIIKPFETDLLLLKISNILTTRELLRQKLNKSVLNTNETKNPSVEELFLSQITTFVHDNIGNMELNVELLADKFYMSKSTLNRKLKAVCNYSSKQFITAIRMQKAAEMLQQNGGNVADVAFAVGYSHNSHFAKAFKNFHGFLPSKYLKKS